MRLSSAFLVFIILFVLPSQAHAYLDPGSGSALFTSIIAALTAGLYSLKGVYYKWIKKDKGYSVGKHEDTLLIFSEGKSYWSTFKPIVTELLKRKIHFRYISLDVYDPALTIESEYMHSKLYNEETTGFGKLAVIKAPVMLSTTPNIGSEGYPMARSPYVGKLVHIFHAIGNSSHYRLGALDFYDSVIMVGPHEEQYLRKVEEIRGIKKKEMIALGLPYLDELYEDLQIHINSMEKNTDNASKTILIAPSWGIKGCFNEFGLEFIKDLSKLGFHIVIRIHPHSKIYEPEKVEAWKQYMATLTNVFWDNNLLSTEAMLQSDIMISDTSSVRYDYAFLHLKPVITLNIPKGNMDEYEAKYHDIPWTEEMSARLGAVVEKAEIKDIGRIVTKTLDTFSSRHLEAFREESVCNFGRSASHIVDYLSQKLEKK